ncbi:MAG TPA: response regulator [bacterium]|nr:response regulator [bacterium]HOL46560.1 response regulator [bacterium]HPQ17869.1 response regulator [bacterium]
MKRINNILIIEDDIDQSELIKWNLENHNYNVIGAIDSIEGLSNFIKSKPDLILLDLNLPFLNGASFYEALMRNNLLNNVPIIIISGEPEIKIKNSIEKIKPLKFFKKPLNLIELISFINSLNNE